MSTVNGALEAIDRQIRNESSWISKTIAINTQMFASAYSKKGTKLSANDFDFVAMADKWEQRQKEAIKIPATVAKTTLKLLNNGRIESWARRFIDLEIMELAASE